MEQKPYPTLLLPSKFRSDRSDRSDLDSTQTKRLDFLLGKHIGHLTCTVRRAAYAVNQDEQKKKKTRNKENKPPGSC